MTTDSTIVLSDTVPAAWLDVLARERAFSYGSTFQPESLWDRFVRWLTSLLGDVLDKNAPAIDVYLWVSLGALIVAIILVWLRNGSHIMRKSNLVVRGGGVDLEDIPADDIDRVIGQEIAEHRWRSAIRYLYLRSLQDLQSSGSISWKKDKTNRDYLQEVASPPLHAVFSEAVRVFERTWYGDEPVDEDSFQRARTVFDSVRQTLRTTA